jgi:hypothetical protein
MKLSVAERIVLNNILPQESDYATLVACKDLREKVVLTQEEIVEYKVEAQGGNIVWDSEKAEEKEFEITDLEKKVVSDTLKELDKNKKLNQTTVTLYDKFI